MLRRPRLIRFASWAILSLIGLWVAYLALGNLFLNARGLEWTIHQATNDADVKLSSAFTWWPGRVIARDLQVIVRTTDVEMDLRVYRVDADIPLLPLFDKEFETRSATVTGVSFRLRETRSLPDLCKQRGLPPIEGRFRRAKKT